MLLWSKSVIDIPVLEIAIFEKPPNIIAAKYSRFTVYVEMYWFMNTHD